MMPDNLFNKNHKATNDKYRRGYDNTWQRDIPTIGERKAAHHDYLLNRAKRTLERIHGSD